MGAKSRVYEFEQFKKVFPKISKDDIVTLDAGHWVHFEKPKETI